MNLKQNVMAMAVIGALMVADGDGTEGGAAGGEAVAAPRKRAPKTNLLDIVRGRLPLALVATIRFHETGTNAEIAKKYGTSVGKVFDIKKGRNFEYVGKDYKPTKEDLAAAEKWAVEAGKHQGDTDGIRIALGALTPANEEEAKAQAATITAARAKTGGKGGKKTPAAVPAGNASELIS